ncbi:MAG TPA: PfkB family carbohydrate kinase [Actinomycetospora sp.]|uniref:PfkB family carbohydrate kinase n=1 Tax=Actinomycetospora sp. TaxID=1872135 RepID=UPI002F417F09
MSAPLVVLGDALLDVDVDGRVTRLCPDAPVPVLDAEAERERPGGAALAALLAALGFSRPVRLVAPLGDDADSRRVRALLDGLVEVVPLPAGGSLPVKSRMLAGERPLLRLDRGGLDAGPWEEAALAAAREALDGAGGVLVADYGRGVTADPGVRELLTRAARRVPVVWDPHPRGADPVPGVTLATPNLDEARAAADGSGASDDWFTTASRAAAALRGVWRAESVTVTAGARGAVLHGGGGLVVVPAEAATGGDPCGAGDRFAGAAALALAAGRTADEAVSDAVAAAGSFVAGGGAGAVRRDADGWHAPGLDSSEGALRSTRSAEGAPRQSADPGPDSTEGALRSTRSAESAPRRNGQHRDGDRASAVVHAARARGARVVATGGCFDLLHAGHARTLGAARELAGEDGVLVVCLNSDASVRRLKGPARPIVGQADRAELLAALACVDAVTVFDEDGPQTVLAHLRPDVWVKGGDYAADDLPEAGLVRSWGGEVVAVPYHAGRSSTRLAAAAGVGAADHHQEGPS